MKINKLLRYAGLSLGMTVALSLSVSAFAANTSSGATGQTEEFLSSQVLEYRIGLAEDGKTYQVWMRPLVTPKPDISLTGQVTLKVPHNADFMIKSVESTVKGADWIEASRVDAPEENASNDYISLSFVGLRGNSAYGYKWAEGQEQLVFSFTSDNGCVDGVDIMALDDPFNVKNNSSNTNPGNQFTNLGWGGVGENNYRGNYGEPITCSGS